MRKFIRTSEENIGFPIYDKDHMNIYYIVFCKSISPYILMLWSQS